MNVSLNDLKALAVELPRLFDDRPMWLKEMPYVTQSGSSYYQFLWELVKRYQPGKILEIGIDKAGSTFCLAVGNPYGNAFSMDIVPEVCQNARAIAVSHGVSNLTVLHEDSLKAKSALFECPLDLLMLDSWHSFDQVYREYVLYRPFVKNGGIILFDDIRYSKEMAVAWDLIPDPKIDLSELHHSGFGACKVDPSITPVSWESIREEAKRRYS